MGETSDIKSSLLEHLKEIGTAVANRKPTGFVFEPCSAGERIRRQQKLVRELAPSCNRRTRG